MRRKRFEVIKPKPDLPVFQTRELLLWYTW
jgi:hypothetical protein